MSLENNQNLFASVELRAKALSLCTIIFFLIYISAGFYADYRNISDSFIFPIEKQIPFIAWFIIPYTSSSLLFVYQFYLIKDKQQLRILTYRILFITIVAGLMFFIFPLKFKFIKPTVDNDMLNYLIHLFKSYDTSYNQAPSLHVSFACIFLTVINQQTLSIYRKILWFIWILLVILSTLFVYQHHLIDVLSGFALVGLTLLLIPNTVQKK